MSFRPSLTSIPSQVVSLEDYESLASEFVEPGAWAYLSGGATDEVTLRENRTAFDQIKIYPRLLRDFSKASTRVTLFRKEYAHPIFVAPTACHLLFHPDGEMATATGAAAMDAGMVVSTQSSHTLEDIAAHARGPLWFQLYMQAHRDNTLQLVRRAESAGYHAIVVTADAPVSGMRNREARAGFNLPPGIASANLRGMHRPRATDSVLTSSLVTHSPTWQDLAWLQAKTRLPVLLKGVLSPEDARMALEQGVSGIIVSNHGGRTLDTLPASIDALPAIVAEIKGRIPILMDGGVRRGTDVYKALNLGAQAVLIGRPCLHGLATAGALGVAHVLKILRTELEVAMVLAGRTSFSSR